MPKGVYERKPTPRQQAIKLSQTYYEGKPCQCGSTMRYVSGQHCVECTRLRNAANYNLVEHQKWCESNREKDRKHKTKWRNQHRDKANACIKHWRKKNPKRHAFYEATRRAKKRNAPGQHTYEDWIALISHFGGVCLSCKKSEEEILAITGRPLTEDHIIPLCNPNTSNAIDNIQPLCFPCNLKNYDHYRKHGTQIDFRKGW
jgi:HNH endonuclease